MMQTENNTPTFVEIYFDNVLMVQGDPDPKRNSAMHSAYKKLLDILKSESSESIVKDHRWVCFKVKLGTIGNIQTNLKNEIVIIYIDVANNVYFFILLLFKI